MRIAFLLPEFPRRNQPYVITQIDALLARGHEVVIHAPPTEPVELDAEVLRRHGHRWREQPRVSSNRLARTLRGLGLVARHFPRHPVLVSRTLDPRRLGRYAASFAALHAGSALMDRPSYDIVHCHFGPSGVFGAMMGELGLLGGPLVVTFYGHDVTRYPLERGPGVYRRLFERARLVLALDPVMKRRLEALGAPADRVLVHPLGVDASRFRPADRPEPAPPLRLLSIGRLVEKKGFADGIRAVARLRAHGVDVVYRIAGDGPLGPDLRGLAAELGVSDAVEFLGQVEHAAVPGLVAGSHVVVVPSVRASDGDEEGTPTVIIEAMACGVPVVSTRHAGVPSLIDDGVSGWLVGEHEPEALADRIRDLAEPERAAAFGAAAHAACLERFETNRLAERLEAHYARILSAGDGA